jgi:putative AlgH/UPF0301 family transcriptional regulator
LFTRGRTWADDKGKQKRKNHFKAFYGGPVSLAELYWLSKADPTRLPPAEEVLPGLLHGRSLAVLDWPRDDERASGEDEEAKGADQGKSGEAAKGKEGGSGSSAPRIKAEDPNVKEEDIWSDPDTKIFFGRAAWVPDQLEAELKEGS